ncbi:hypothetical protein EsH8_X_000158 [Colletotrichum jinshuiense]
MAENMPQQSFGATKARNLVVGSQFSGTTNITFNGGPDEAKGLQAEKEACLRSLAFRDIHARRHDIVPAHPDTCDWLFNTPEFQQWIDPAYLQDHNGVFWIKGKPGAGKSTLMKHAFHHYQKSLFSDHLLLAYFFNARGETLEKTPLGMLRSIVYQLLQNDDTLYEQFLPSFREKQRTSQEGNFHWRLSELQEFMRSVVTKSQSKPFLLLVDALDECHESEVRDVVAFLESLSISASRDGIQLKVFLSSRHYPSIRIAKAIELTVEKSAHHQIDIAQYVRERLIVSDADIEAEILKKADGIFLWVVIVVSLLNKAYDEGRIEAMRRTLEELQGDLEKIFSTILDKDVTDMAETVLMLQWVLLSKRPLKPREIFAAVVKTAPPTSDLIQRRITTSSKGLIEIRKESTETVQFIHLSVSDFLFRYKRLQTLDATLGPEPITTSHGRLWARCWSCIEQVDTASVRQQHMRELYDNDSFLSYAACYIFNHAEEALSNDAMLRKGDDWCGREEDPSNATWRTSIHNWLRELDRWFQWWKLFINATGAYTEVSELEEEDAEILYFLALRGLPNLIRALPESANINAQGGWHGNALNVASHRGHRKTVELLLEKGADVHMQGGYYGNALQAASFGGHQEIVDLLLKKGVDINMEGGVYGNALQAAAYQGRQKVVELLLEKGANIHKQGGVYGNALQAAVCQGDQNIVKLLLEKGADIHMQGGEFGNALQAAAYQGDQEVVGLLLEKGAEINTQGGRYGNALQAAAYQCHQDVVEILLEKGADVSAQGGEFGNALQAAAYQGDQEVVGLLLEKGAEINTQGGWYGNALQAAAYQGGHRIVKMLLEKGADVHAQGGHFDNALQAASSKGNPDIVRLLRENGAVLSDAEVMSTLINPKQEVVSVSTKPTISPQLTSLWWGIFIVLMGWLILRFVASDE